MPSSHRTPKRRPTSIRQWPLDEKILLDEASESVVLFERTKGDQESISFTRYDLAGEVSDRISPDGEEFTPV